MSVRIEGMGALRKALLQVSGEGRKVVEKEVKRAALNVQTGAKKRTPVDTGRLRNSIATEELDEGTAAQVGTNVEYAEHVHFGARGRPEVPFLFNALEEESPRFAARLRKALTEGFRRAAE